MTNEERNVKIADAIVKIMRGEAKPAREWTDEQVAVAKACKEAGR